MVQTLTIALIIGGTFPSASHHANFQRERTPVNAGPRRNMVENAKARALLERVFSAYHSCRTYSDEGTVVSSGFQEGKFSTRFKRPYRICFRYQASGPKGRKSAFWTTGARTRIYCEGKDGPGYWLDTIPTSEWDARYPYGLTENEYISTQARYSGYTSSAGTIIPKLLIPIETLSLTFKEMPDLLIEPEAKYRHRKCVVLKSRTYHTQIWIDKKTLLILRVVSSFPDLPTTEVTYSPKVNVPINDKELSLVPRGEKS